MKRSILIISLVIHIVSFAQKDYKQKGLEAFKKEHYKKAIALMDSARIQNQSDPEVYYYLGFFSHYLANDSRPLEQYNMDYSKKVFDYLSKAIELNPGLANAKYFYGAECSANAFKAIQENNADKLRYFYAKADSIGAYPPWLKEFGRNMLDACPQNSILFTGGNADTDVALYIQLHENYRTDISVMPIGNIDRPWFVGFLKKGLPDTYRPVQVSLTENQIMDMHPYKWDTAIISIDLDQRICHMYNLAENHKFLLKVTPDLFSNRQHSKIEGEHSQYRTYLSPGKAVLIHIIENNINKRPICFSNLINGSFINDLNEYFTYCGLIRQLVPLKTSGTPYAMNSKTLTRMVNKNRFGDYASVMDKGIPRIKTILYQYHYMFALWGKQLYTSSNQAELKKVVEAYSRYMKTGYEPELENTIENQLNLMLEKNEEKNQPK